MFLTFGDTRHLSFASSAAFIAARNFWNWVASLTALERGFEWVFVKTAMTSGVLPRQFNRRLLDGLLGTGCATINPGF
jgi:hypothetical protein